MVSLAFMNLFHGFPFFVIVWHVAHERQRQIQQDGILDGGAQQGQGQQEEEEKGLGSLSSARYGGLSARAMRAMTEGGGRGARTYLLLLLTLGVFESLLWELLIVKEYHKPEDLWPGVRWASPTLEGKWLSFAVALVNMPQVRRRRWRSSLPYLLCTATAPTQTLASYDAFAINRLK